MPDVAQEPVADATPGRADGDELRCPLCEYDLRGLTEPRCPECGYHFAWAEIRDPARRLHPYLFEHHPERNAWSFVRTLRGGLRPRRFWAQLTPTTPSNPRRLVRYWLLTVALVLPGFALALVGTARELHADNVAMRAIMTRQYFAPGAAVHLAKLEMQTGLKFPAYLDRSEPLFPSRRFMASVFAETMPRFILAAWIVSALWPSVTVLVTRVLLWISLRRARVRMIHLARCAIHAADVMAWYSLALTAVVAFLCVRSLQAGPAFLPSGMGMSLAQQAMLAMAIALLAALLVAWYRLVVAMAKYLRLPHALAVVLLTQVLVLVAVLALMGTAVQIVDGVLRAIAWG